MIYWFYNLLIIHIFLQWLAVGESNGVRFLRQILRNTTSKCSIIHKVLSVLFPCLAMNLLQKLLRTIQVLKIVDFWCGKCSWADALQTWQSKKTLFLTLAERAQFESPTASHWSIIRTRLKISIFGIFCLVVLERHKAFLRPSHQNLSKNTRFLGRRILRLSKIVIIKPKTQVILSD